MKSWLLTHPCLLQMQPSGSAGPRRPTRARHSVARLVFHPGRIVRKRKNALDRRTNHRPHREPQHIRLLCDAETAPWYVVMSMRVMSAGSGYRYLLRTTVVADSERSMSDALTRYYAEKGTPPGLWLGSGVRGLGDGQLHQHDGVSETHLRLLLGMGCDPVTGEPLGRAWADFASVADRIDRQVRRLPLAISL